MLLREQPDITLRMLHWRLALTFALALLSTLGCATRYAPSSQYHNVLRQSPDQQHGDKTTLLFLVDGLSLPPLQSALAAGRLPNLKRFFLSREAQSGEKVYVGKAVFPTLTFPNIASILTGVPPSQHGITGNQVYNGSELINYESPANRTRLNQYLETHTQFTRLKSLGMSSLSLDHYFYAGATVRQPDDIKTAVAYTSGNFRYIDEKSLDALEQVLSSTPPRLLPELIFTHLIGLDALSHRDGPMSQASLEYLRWLDRKLGKVFKQIEDVEDSHRKILTLLTSDHGFMTVREFADAAKYVERLAADREMHLQIVNQGRYLELYLKNRFSKLEEVSKILASTASVDWVVMQEPVGLRLISKQVDIALHFLKGNCPDGVLVKIDAKRGLFSMGFACPSELDKELDRQSRNGAIQFPPELISSITRYFQAKNSPDALILAAQNVTFNSGMKGQHGGLTSEELYVPVLLRNLVPAYVDHPIPTLELLRFLDLPPARSRVSQVSSFSKISNPVTHSVDVEGAHGIATLVKLSTPISFVSIHGVDLRSQQPNHSDSSFSPSMNLAMRRNWNSLMSSELQYGFLYFGNQTALHHVGFSEIYHFREDQELSLSAGFGQDLFLGSTRVWIPELRFGSVSTLFATGFGDLTLGGGLSVLLRGLGNDYTIYSGFKQDVRLTFEQSMAGTDLLGVFLDFEHLTQNSVIETHERNQLKLGVSYSLSFERK